ncbi:hypothetical protein cyc_01929 [Cyclospora cayetanensis]|uniref:Uncharacterized protein n=1 Tax=Cyclospora cayetanensis TaxID=88456 RepID=A0A1D3D278_9EIME|nr:hypothetical protein cyc_01929 [Cyclospora cayetanensis]
MGTADHRPSEKLRNAAPLVVVLLCSLFLPDLCASEAPGGFPTSALTANDYLADESIYIHEEASAMLASLNTPGALADKAAPKTAAPTSIMDIMYLMSSMAKGEKSVAISNTVQPIVRFMRECLDRLADRLRRLQGKDIKYDGDAFRQLGCIAVSNMALNGIQGTVALFPSSFLSRLTVSIPHVSTAFHQPYDLPCIKPIALAIHERSNPSLHPGGAFNTDGQCSAEMIGGRHDPGLACGPDGSELCRTLSIPPFDNSTGNRDSQASYTCQSTLYSSRPFSCNAGDLTGKFGFGRDLSVSPQIVDMRVLAMDSSPDNPCGIGSRLLPLVLSCSTSGRRLACSPFQVVGSVPSMVVPLLQELVLETTTALLDQPTMQEVIGALKSSVELESRVMFLEAAAEGVSPTPGPSPLPPPEDGTTTTTMSPTFTTRGGPTSTSPASTTTTTTTPTTAPHTPAPPTIPTPIPPTTTTTTTQVTTTNYYPIPGPPRDPLYPEPTPPDDQPSPTPRPPRRRRPRPAPQPR